MKKKMITLTAALFMSAVAVMGQSSNDWSLITTSNNVSIYYETGSCRNSEVVFIKVVNNSKETKVVDFSLFGNTTAKKVEVKAGETINGACENKINAFTLTENIPTGKTIKDMAAVVHVNSTTSK